MAGRTLNKSKSEQVVAPVQQQVTEEVVEEKTDTEENIQEKQSDQTEGVEEKTPKLFAMYPILFESHQYKIGEQLPTHDMDMVEAWIESEAAIWK